MPVRCCPTTSHPGERGSHVAVVNAVVNAVGSPSSLIMVNH